MIKPIKYDDVFGYDDAGRPCALQITKNFYAFGYEFCREVKSLIDAGYLVAHSRFTDGAAFIYILEPKTGTVELWKGPYEEDEKNIFSTINPKLMGILDQKFKNFVDLRKFASTKMSRLAVRPGKLSRK